MSKLTVKIKRTTLIPKLQEALKVAQDRLATYNKAMENYAKEMEKYEAKRNQIHDQIRKMTPATLAKIVAKAPKSAICKPEFYEKICSIRLDYSLFDASYAAPADPSELPENEGLKVCHAWKRGYGNRVVNPGEEKIAEIKNAINILNLSEDEFVSTSTYNTVAKFL